MKRSFKAILLLSAAFFFAGCTTGLETEINDLAKRVTDLETYCAELNTNISTLQTLANALKSQNYISGVSDYKEDGVKVGYQINFSDGTYVVIYNGKDGADGKDGDTPVIGIAEGEDGNLYWTVTYSGGTTTFLTDSLGNKILAVGIDGKDGKDGEKGDQGDTGDTGATGSDGITPQLKIDDGYWYVSVDAGQTWTEVGQATGDAGDAVFESVDTSDPDYVVFTLVDGTSFSVPTESAFTSISDKVEEMNEQITAVSKLVDSIFTNSVFVSSITFNIDGSDTLSYNVTFSDGTAIVLNKGVNGKDASVPEVTASKYEDGVYYWQVTVGDSTSWMLDGEGNMIQAAASDGNDGITPVVGVEDSAGIYYWTMQYGDGNAEWVLDPEGGKVKASSEDGTSFFANVDVSSGEYAIFTMADSSVVKIPLYSAYEALMGAIDTINTNINSMSELAEALEERTYIKETEAIIYSDGDTVGYYISLSNGKSLYLYNGLDAAAPVMGVAQDTDGIYYWTVRYGTSRVNWVYDDEGNKVKAVAEDGEDGSTPAISVSKEEDGLYYWVVVNGSDTTYVEDSEGNKVTASAVKGEDGTSFFSSVTSDSDYLTIVLADSTTTFRIPIYKEFALTDWTYGENEMGTEYTLTTTGETTSYALNFTLSCSYITDPEIQYYTTSGIESVSVGEISYDSNLSTFTGTINVTFNVTPLIGTQKLLLFFGDGKGKVVMRSVYFN
ncbi:MAG: DUF4988 domain-containing protein [Bacteroidales bacterium]|jgi:prefoldin subunit 5|nr:DUF4988 domain-containing protein [Bacteroidales bacterium]MCI2121153.1 DUF4988 domain-containing protein [Bacteroidales bacterium]MCI2144742.1 DUF4988 domain-containing protein [Bacteroidales bacterium]